MLGTVSDLDRYDPSNPQLAENPWPIYAGYCREDPVHWGHAVNPMLPGAWFVFDYDNVREHLTNPRLHINPRSVGMQEEFPESFKPAIAIFDQWLGATDEPEHAPIRKLMLKGFSPRKIMALGAKVEALAADLLDQALSTSDGHFDFVAAMAFPLPIIVICEFLGVPSGERALFGELSRDFMAAVANPGDDTVAAKGSQAALAMRGYMTQVCLERRANPRDDFISVVVQAVASGEVELTAEQLAAVTMELVIGGHETTVNGLSGGLLGLLQQRDQYEQLCHDPEANIRSTVEEILRWTSPVKRPRNRWALEDIEIGSRQVKRGEPVYLMVAAANRDERHFAEPDRIDIHREGSLHLAFGHGPHFCLGSALARMEIQTAFKLLAERLPNLEVEPSRLRWRDNVVLAGPSELWVQAGGSAK